MKKKVSLILIFSFTIIYSQNNCDKIKSENDSLKKLLNLYNNHKPNNFENLEITFFKAIGDVKKQIVTIEFLIKNIGAINEKYIFDNIEIIDEENNSKQLYRYGFGPNSASIVAVLLPNVEQKYSCIIENVAPTTMLYVKYITFRITGKDLWKSFYGKINGDKIEWK